MIDVKWKKEAKRKIKTIRYFNQQNIRKVTETREFCGWHLLELI